MLETAIAAYRNALVRWVDLVRRRAATVLVAATAVTAGASYYVATNQEINTDTDAMLAEDLPFRAAEREFQAAFPQLSDILLVVIEGENPDLVEDAGSALAGRLTGRPDLYRSVYHPAGDPFFQRNGLLFLDESALIDLTDELAAAQPLLATLAQDESLWA